MTVICGLSSVISGILILIVMMTSNLVQTCNDCS